MTPEQELCKEIFERREKRLADKIKPWPRKNVIASDIPWCERQGVYSIVAWDKRQPHDTRLQARFEKGDMEQGQVERELGEMGLRVVETECPLPREMFQKYGITGRIDFKLEWRGKRVPCEVKSMHPRFWDKFKTVDDLKGYLFTARYYRQMQIYLLGNNEEGGLFILTDCLGHWTLIPCPLDYQEAEHCLQMAEAINEAVAEKRLPERIPYDDEICGRCAFTHECIPDIEQRAAVVFEDDPEAAAEFETKLSRRAELADAAKEFETLDKEVKDEFKERYVSRDIRIAQIGEWTLTGTNRVTTRYEIPDEEKPKYAKKVAYWVTKIARLGAKAEAA